jgi:ParB family transcriptional regulator, chromosome partitioning protein
MNNQRIDRPRHLGRGLESLLGPVVDSAPAAVPAQATVGESNSPKLPVDTRLKEALVDVRVEDVSPNPYQARTVWNEEDLRVLSESIKANGVIQPILVRPFQGRYQLIAGERRLRATKLAGISTIPALVREVVDDDMFEWSLVENIHRRDLNPVERAKAYQRFLNAFSLTQAEAGERLGEDRSVIANYLRLLELHEEIREMLVDGRLTMGHARAILGLPTDELRRKLANRAMAGRLSVREVERLVRLYTAEQGAPAKKQATKQPHIVDLESKLRRQLGTRVAIETRRNGERGRIVIEFDSLDHFDRITETLGLTCGEDS